MGTPSERAKNLLAGAPKRPVAGGFAAGVVEAFEVLFPNRPPAGLGASVGFAPNNPPAAGVEAGVVLAPAAGAPKRPPEAGAACFAPNNPLGGAPAGVVDGCDPNSPPPAAGVEVGVDVAGFAPNNPPLDVVLVAPPPNNPPVVPDAGAPAGVEEPPNKPPAAGAPPDGAAGLAPKSPPLGAGVEVGVELAGAPKLKVGVEVAGLLEPKRPPAGVDEAGALVVGAELPKRPPAVPEA